MLCRDTPGARDLAELNVVVFGEFKRAKSTLVNAFLGQELLPAAVVPLTETVTAAVSRLRTVAAQSAASVAVRRFELITNRDASLGRSAMSASPTSAPSS
jgi:Dynamin family